MIFTSITALLTLIIASLAHAQLTYNVTQANAPGNSEKYSCFDYPKANALLPECLHECHAKANAADGCAVDDYVCHCVNFEAYSKLIEPCAFPATLGGAGNCTLADLGTVRPVINDLCNFFNATLYTTYEGCGIELSKEKTTAIIAGRGEEIEF